MTQWSDRLRLTLSANAQAYAQHAGVAWYRSLGTPGIVLFPPSDEADTHGNFHPSSYQAIVGHAQWAPRLRKPHSSRTRALPPPFNATACEMDSCTSSDALLMNIMCYPGVVRGNLAALLSVPDDAEPQFGVPGAVPLQGGRTDATEVDMRIGGTHVEAKLTETSFTTQRAAIVSQYQGLRDVFDHDALPRVASATADEPDYVSYQLLRNVLAIARHPDRHFRVLLDGRRPDLLREWWTIFGAIRDPAVRSRCGFVLWQELAAVCPAPLQEFLVRKYGL
jgi:hypothetical protein